jgi:hypothetical protein
MRFQMQSSALIHPNGFKKTVSELKALIGQLFGLTHDTIKRVGTLTQKSPAGKAMIKLADAMFYSK